MEEYTQEMCIKDTQKHIEQVQLNLYTMIRDLIERALKHDKSKLESPELEIFTEYTPKLNGTTYGSPEYFEHLKGMQVALDHHYAVNSHHPEHYPNGIQGMTLLDILEMFCDWKAASMRHADGDFNHSIEYNQKRFNISEELTQVFRNTAGIFDNK
ncbi:hypothetical protein M3_0194 [Lysinibacillus phage vB_LfM_LysYB1]|nr:hypothetical protein M3_0194 [Lysinibacillus phage vB_LfM_LysYB1]WAB25294.1 hypothetical protein M5_0116 [Lysinibacillus phage vB_LfM_LysYB2]